MRIALLRTNTLVRTHAIAALSVLLVACVPAAEDEPEMVNTRPEGPGVANIVSGGDVLIGVFPGSQDAEGGTAMASRAGMDFVFYDLENGPFDLAGFHSYVDAMHETLGPDAPRRPMAIRIPPVGDDHEGALERAALALEAGADIIVVPHVQNAEQAAVAVQTSGLNTWPGDESGIHLNLMIVEDQEGIANVSEIVGTPGASIVFAGPGDLRRAYEGDMEAVETAIQAVLAACKEHGVTCGVTASAENIGERIEQGFRAFIVTNQETVDAGLAAAGR